MITYFKYIFFIVSNKYRENFAFQLYVTLQYNSSYTLKPTHLMAKNECNNNLRRLHGAKHKSKTYTN